MKDFLFVQEIWYWCVCSTVLAMLWPLKSGDSSPIQEFFGGTTVVMISCLLYSGLSFWRTEIWLRCWASWPYNFLIFSTWLSILPFFCSTFREISSIVSSPFKLSFPAIMFFFNFQCPFNFPNVHLFQYLVPCLQSFSSDPWEHMWWLSFLLPAYCFFQFVTCFDCQHSGAWPSANI